MKKIAFTTLAAMGAIALPAAAQAQSNDTKAEVTVGATIGLHDLGLDTDGADFDGFDIDDSGEIYGGFVAVDVPVGESLFVGAEGNASFGSGPIDAEYGLSARFGVRTENGGKFYLRGGYQWIDVDAGELIGVPDLNDGDLGISTTVDDYLVGVGAEFPVSSVVLRANLDTVSFDTVRGTIGVGFKF